MTEIQEDQHLHLFLLKIEPVFKKTIKDINNPEDLAKPNDPWATIAHGDFSIFNIMYRADRNGTVDVIKFVDFPGFMYIHPIHDLAYFLFTSVDKETQDMHMDHLIKHYYQNFTKILTLMGITSPDLFSESAYNEEMRKNVITIFPVFILVLKVIFLYIIEI